MACQGAPSVKQLFIDANRLAPNRSKVSDGVCASQAHHAANPSSDHEAGPNGLAHAGDVTHDPAGGWDAHKRAREVVARRDARVKYIISNRKIISYYPVGGYPAWAERPYHGANPHDHHAHTSIKPGSTSENDTRPWWPTIEEDDLAGVGPQILAEVQALSGRVKVLEESTGAIYPGGPSVQKALVKYEDADNDPTTPKIPVSHLDILNDKMDEIVNTLGELAAAVKKLAEQ